MTQSLGRRWRSSGPGKMHRFRVKTLAPVLWKKAGPGYPLRLLVVAPVGYRLRKGSKLLYRQPAYLICTDPDLPLDLFLQLALWRWDIEVNHRDEKQIIGVGEAQVWSSLSVARQPALAVASYAMLLLAGERAFQGQQTRGAVRLPKWQHKDPQQRMSTQELLRQLRSEVWRYAIDHAQVDSDHFVTTPEDSHEVVGITVVASPGLVVRGQRLKNRGRTPEGRVSARRQSAKPQ